MVAPPSGTITFLFTDIEGSTRLWERDAIAMRSALNRHDEILRSSIEGYGGYIFKTVGDAFCAAFGSASNAIEAALGIQRALHTEEWEKGAVLRVRMALHTGIVEEQQGDYFGPPVNRVARLLSAGHGGQILLSLATQELVRDALPAGVSLEDLGERRLKDLFRPERVFQVVAADLPSEFPPLRTLESLRNNLPPQSTPLVGREREVDEVCGRLLQEEIHLLTLTGPGGTGKTRIALQAAADLLEEFEDGVFFVYLATVTDSDLFFNEIAGALALQESGVVSLKDALEEYLGRRELLLVLDNFEQVLSAAPLVGELLNAAPRLKVLATSRIPLGIYGEHEYAVPPLSVPDPRRLPDLGTLSQYEAVRLFIERAQAAKAGFEITNDNAPSIAEICARLDGLPLAIELAAARIKLLPPKAILTRLTNRLKLLTGGAKNLPARQRTLRGAIEWSHDLLDEGERTLFARLAVFSGGRTLEAIEAVCDAEGDLPVDALDGVASLLDKSLLTRVEGPEDEPRFVMLETIHEFAREKLQESGEAEEIGRAHAQYFLALVEEAEPELYGPDQVSWMDRVEAEHDNFRAALSWTLEEGDAESALRIGGVLWRFWTVRGHLSEGRRWLSEGLSRAEGVSIGVRARGLLALGDMAKRQSDYAEGQKNLEASLALYREIGERQGAVLPLVLLGWIAMEQGDLDRAEELLEESLALSRQAGTDWDVAYVLNGLFTLESYRGNQACAVELLEESLSTSRKAGDLRGSCVATSNLGFTAIQAGDYERAEALLHEAQEVAQQIRNADMVTQCDLMLGFLALARNDLDRAQALCVKVMRELREWSYVQGIDFALDILGGVAAARIWGGAAGYREVSGIPWLPDEREMIEPHIEAARARLDQATWQEEWEKGRSMSLDQTMGYALENKELA